jgi:hypothetical protein
MLPSCDDKIQSNLPQAKNVLQIPLMTMGDSVGLVAKKAKLKYAEVSC